MGIRQQGFQSNILQRPADGKMVETLKPVIAQPEYFMHLIIEETADSGTAQTARFRLQIENLPNQPGFCTRQPSTAAA
jgi:hypothetical protein